MDSLWLLEFLHTCSNQMRGFCSLLLGYLWHVELQRLHNLQIDR